MGLGRGGHTDLPVWTAEFLPAPQAKATLQPALSRPPASAHFLDSETSGISVRRVSG